MRDERKAKSRGKTARTFPCASMTHHPPNLGLRPNCADVHHSPTAPAEPGHQKFSQTSHLRSRQTPPIPKHLRSFVFAFCFCFCSKPKPRRRIMSSPEPADEVATPFKIGSGSFAAVFVVRGGPLAFKIVHAPEHHETLRKEYEALIHLYRTCNKTSFSALSPGRVYARRGGRPQDDGVSSVRPQPLALCHFRQRAPRCR